MLVDRRSGRVVENSIEVPSLWWSLFFLAVKLQVLSGKIIMFPYHIFMLLVNFWFICLQGLFPILRKISCRDLCPLMCPLRRLLALDRGRILIPGVIRPLPILSRLLPFPLSPANKPYWKNIPCSQTIDYSIDYYRLVVNLEIYLLLISVFFLSIFK